ncbi:MAG: FtsQ-type POTRA domain-containing protein [Humibacter sp.]
MKRPQGFENSASRLTARAEPRVPPADPATSAGRKPRAGSKGAASAGSTDGTSSAAAPSMSTGLLDASAGEPDATTEPIPVIPTAKTSQKRTDGFGESERAGKAEGVGKAGRVGEGAATHDRPAWWRTLASSAETGTESRTETVEDAPAQADSPSVRAAARRRRRYERAEVKRFTRGARRRRLAWFIGVGSAVVVLAGAALVSISPAMALRTIDVVGTQRVNAADVKHALGAQLGTPLPLLNSGEIKTSLAKFPLIRSYSIQAEPPGTLVVRVVERTPLALLQVPTGYQLVDQAGVVIQSTAERPGGYPVITLPKDASSSSRQKEFAASAAVLAALPASMLSQVGSVSATGAQEVTLKLTSGPTVVWGGPDQPDLKSAVLSILLKKAPGASVYDVSAPNSPVTR